MLVHEALLPVPGSDDEKVIRAFVEGGRGVVVTHRALGGCSGTTSPRATTQPARPGITGKMPRWCPMMSSGDSHPPVHFLDVRIVRPVHPIVHGLPGQFRTADSLPSARGIQPGTEILAATTDEKSGGGDGPESPVLATLHAGKGASRLLGLGHDLAAMQENEFMTIFARAAEWAATGQVTLPAVVSLPRPRADAVRGLVITGGHDHETAFYSLFDGYDDLARMPVASSATAFQADLRAKYDVLIMYDFTRDLDETGKKNLRDFVESGKGVVVLHHALLNYQQWHLVVRGRGRRQLSPARRRARSPRPP